MHDGVAAAGVMLHQTALCDVALGETLPASSQYKMIPKIIPMVLSKHLLVALPGYSFTFDTQPVSLGLATAACAGSHTRK